MSTETSDLLKIVLFTKSGCHLCDNVKAKLAVLQAEYPHTLDEIDITSDPELHKKYLITIPVLHIGDLELEAPITFHQLIAALEATLGTAPESTI